MSAESKVTSLEPASLPNCIVSKSRNVLQPRRLRRTHNHLTIDQPGRRVNPRTEVDLGSEGEVL